MNLKLLQNTPPWEWPKSASNTFHQVLTNKQSKPSDRLLAAELAGEVCAINDELANDLLTIARRAEEPEPLRARAVLSLGPVLEEADTLEFENADDVPIGQPTFRKVQQQLQALYLDESAPKQVRRKTLEASVRAPQDWHRGAIKAAYASGDPDWILSAVFAMFYVRGFNAQILEALNSPDPDVHSEAVEAAGNWQIEAAWPHILELIENPATSKDLLIAAIGAAGAIRPLEAPGLLADFADSDDEEVSEAAEEALALAEGVSALGGENMNEWIN